MTRSLYGGSAVLTGALLLVALTFNASPSVAENLAADSNQQTQTQQATTPSGTGLLGETSASAASAPAPEPATPAAPDAVKPDARRATLSSDRVAAETTLALPQRFTATAYSLRGRTASGAFVRRGLIAADRRVLPLGTRVRLEAGPYSGEYLVADVGGVIRGRLIDIWMPTTREAMRFGRRSVKVTVLSYGARRAPRARKTRRT